MSGKAVIIRSDARNLPLPDASVDLIVTSPPYFGLRSYRDNGEHYEGQVGSEATPQEFLEALWGCMQEWWRVLKPEGSCFVNLGDKRAGSGGHNNTGLTGGPSQLAGRSQRVTDFQATRRNAPDRYNQASFGRTKSKMLIPHRFAIGCEDGLADPEGIGWVMRQDLIWQKLNGLPESVTDRHRDSHEYIFHFTKQERYFAAMDEVRERQADVSFKRAEHGKETRTKAPKHDVDRHNIFYEGAWGGRETAITLNPRQTSRLSLAYGFRTTPDPAMGKRQVRARGSLCCLPDRVAPKADPRVLAFGDLCGVWGTEKAGGRKGTATRQLHDERG